MMRRCLLALVLVWAGCLPAAGQSSKPTTLTLDVYESAGISGFPGDWNAPKPGEKTFDAANRSVLLRFPGAAERLWAKMAQGLAIDLAHVVLTYKGYETQPPHYVCRPALGVKKWTENPPQWHVIAWPLRRPWKADAKTGPTFNAFIHGAGYWAKYGAQGTGKDRFPQTLGPAELSKASPEARLDVTALLTADAYGRTAGERLRQIEECGLLLRKLETHDMRYDEFWSAYEWANPTGGHGLSFENARLAVTFRPGRKARGTLPLATDIDALAESLTESGSGGSPTAVVPNSDALRLLSEKCGFKRPEWMPDWQWERVRQLRGYSGGRIAEWVNKLESGDPTEYNKIVGEIMAIPPRFWQGWGIQEDLLLWYIYRDVLPAPVHDQIRAYWDGWLMPDVPTERFFHAQSRENEDYWNQTHDWRGRKSFFRNGYNYVISTMNFNHTAAMGALLGGHIIGSERAMADGRHGLEHLPMRLWAWYDGTTQESIDHYYFSITLSGQKMFADFGPTHLDRLMGQSILAKAVEELISSYHPSLRRFVSTSGRTGIGYLWVIQDGLQHIVHTLSRRGALHDLDNKETNGMPVFGTDGPPARIALQTIPGPWAPEWAANIVDEKPLPYEITVSAKEWGHFAETPMWKRTYLGQHYGLASVDIGRYGSVPVMAQWRRTADPVGRIQQVGTLLARFGINTTKLATTNGGSGLMQGGNIAAVHHKNKMVLLTSPLARLDNANPLEIKSLQTTLGLFTFEKTPSWELFVDGEPVRQLPLAVKAGQRIALKDGVTYLGLIPLPSTDLGRSVEVEISADGVEESLQGGGTARPALLVQQYLYKSDASLDKAKFPWETIDQAYGGFVVELADATEFPDFAAFQAHFRSTTAETRWEAGTKTLHVACKSGPDTLEFGFRPEYQVYPDKAVPTDQCFPYRKVNGQWPYLAPGMDRDSTLTQQGTTGRLEKNGATLACEPGRMAYLQTEPISGTYAGFNPLPDPSLWSLSLPEGVRISADGRVGLLRVVVRPKENKLWIDYAAKDDQRSPDMAAALLVFGLTGEPDAEFNGKKVKERLGTAMLGGEDACVIPLSDKDLAQISDGLAKRARRAQETLVARLGGRRDIFLHDWHIVGPFAKQDTSTLWTGLTKVYPPEQKVDLGATYAGMDRVDGKQVDVPIRWRRILRPGEPVLQTGPVNLASILSPNKSACAFAFTKVKSDRKRAVTLYTGSDQSLAVWLNGEEVLDKVIFRAAAPDQDKVKVTLRKGENQFLLRTINGWEGWSFYFRLGDDYGLPVEDGVEFGLGGAE